MGGTGNGSAHFFSKAGNSLDYILALIETILYLVTYFVTTHVVRLKLFRLKAEGVRKARLPHFGGDIWFLHQTCL
jgi:hypothetical protein